MCAHIHPGAVAGVVVLGLVRHGASLGLHTASLGLVLATASFGLVLVRPATGSFHRLPLPLPLLHHQRAVDAVGAVVSHVQVSLWAWPLGVLPGASVLPEEAVSLVGGRHPGGIEGERFGRGERLGTFLNLGLSRT